MSAPWNDLVLGIGDAGKTWVMSSHKPSVLPEI